MRYLDKILAEDVTKIFRKSQKKLLAWDLAKKSYIEKTWRGGANLAPPPVQIGLKIATIFAYVSIFLCVVKKSGKIGQNQENRDKIKFGAYFPSKHGIYDRMHQITQH